MGKQQWLIKSWLFAPSAKRSEHWKNAVGLAPRTASGVFATSWWRFGGGSRTARFGGCCRPIAATTSCLSSRMTNKLSIVALAACIATFSLIGMRAAQTKQQCSAAMPSNPHGYWSWRLIGGRKCWYEGKPMLSKLSLEWPHEASAKVDSSERNTGVVPEKPGNPVVSQTWAPASQAIAPEELATFETRWRDRANIEARAPPEETVSLKQMQPATHESADGPPLKKADRLQLPYFESRQAKAIRTIVIVPNQPLSAVGAKEMRLGPSSDRRQ